LLACVSGLSQGGSSGTRDHVYVLSSSDAPGRLAAERMNSCLQEVTRQWKQDAKMLPMVVVFHVSRRVAKAAMVNENFAIRHKHSPNRSDSYYEIWIVEPKTEDYVLALEAIVEDRFQLRPTDPERAEVLLRLVRVQNATVSVFEGQ
jgi:hypothetical protein